MSSLTSQKVSDSDSNATDFFLDFWENI